MSVQAGIWNYDGKPVDPEWLNRLSRSVAEYGPDGEGIYCSGSIAMLHRSFHTTIESRSEAQPFVAKNDCIITFDGRLDNRDQLIDQLSDTLAGDRSDPAIVATAFERWGRNFLVKLIGDWALAIWNPRKHELILARDYIGMKQLFYRVDKNGVSWCNHLAALLPLGEQSTLSDEYVAGYLVRCAHADLTPYCGIYSVPPAQIVSISDHKVRTQPYWQFNARARTFYKTSTEYEEHFLHLFRQAVRRRLRSHTPVLAELSGGFDSSSIVCVADDILRNDGSLTPAIDTFSYSFPDEPDADDHLYFTKVEARRGRIGHRAEIRAVGDSFCLDYSSLVATPGFGGRQEVLAAGSAVVKDGKYRVILSGLGGDEFIGQSLDPRVHMADLMLRFQIGALAHKLKEWSLLFRRPWIQVLFETAALLRPLSIRRLLAEVDKEQNWMDVRFVRRHKRNVLRLEPSKGVWSWRPSARDWYETYATLSSLLTNLRPSSAEVRYPYLDQTFVEFLTSIPTDQLLRPGDRRSLMRRALVGILPSEILSRKTKQSEARCYAVTLAKHWDRLEGIFAAPISSALGYTRGSYLLKALEAYKNGRPSKYPVRLLRALSLELWLRDMIARDIIAAPQQIRHRVAPGSGRSPIVSLPSQSSSVDKIRARYPDSASSSRKPQMERR